MISRNPGASALHHEVSCLTHGGDARSKDGKKMDVAKAFYFGKTICQAEQALGTRFLCRAGDGNVLNLDCDGCTNTVITLTFVGLYT